MLSLNYSSCLALEWLKCFLNSPWIYYAESLYLTSRLSLSWRFGSKNLESLQCKLNSRLWSLDWRSQTSFVCRKCFLLSRKQSCSSEKPSASTICCCWILCLYCPWLINKLSKRQCLTACLRWATVCRNKTVRPLIHSERTKMLHNRGEMNQILSWKI